MRLEACPLRWSEPAEAPDNADATAAPASPAVNTRRGVILEA
jgi:hypothetical protein